MTTVQFEIGKDLDRGVCATPRTKLGHLTTGPRGLLQWLESQLGLELPTASFTARMVPYLNCLQQRDSADAFYHKSLQRDEFGVARTLLQWRDTWFEAGWNGDGFDVDASLRLLELGSIEDLAEDAVPPGMGQRVQRILRAFDSASVDVEVTLLDPPEVFPAVWQALFVKLGAKAKIHTLVPQCQNESDLALLQRALVNERAAEEKIKLAGDGTVVVLRDGSPQLSASWIARYAHLNMDATGDVAVLASDNGATLDDALVNAGFPRLGFSDASFWRPAFQVLPLSLELIWRPLDPTVLLQFLTHPMGPIPRNIRRILSETAARQPGIGGEGWLEAVEMALDKAAKDETGAAATAIREAEAKKIDFWLGCDRFGPREGVALDVLVERVQRVCDWLTAAYNAQDGSREAEVYGAALGQAEELLRTLDRLDRAGAKTLTRESVRRLVEAVRGTGTSRPGRAWQCADGAPQLLRSESPAGFLQPVDTVIWWGCDKARLPGAYPWSKSEIDALKNSGVDLLPLNTQLEWQANSWLRPLLSAKRRLVFVLHDNAESHHPVFDQVFAVAEGWAEERVDRLMRNPQLLPLANRLPSTGSIARQEIPRKARWWQLPADLEFPRRRSESFTSLEKFLYGPHQWILNYQARIRPGALDEVAEGSMLKGLLTHDLFEQFFKAHPDIAAIEVAAARTWAREHILRLIEQRGAVLFMPGRQSERAYYIDMAVRALTSLVEHLQSAKVVSVEMERYIDGQFAGGALNGSIDLMATKADGQCAVVDIKWGGLSYRRDSLQESKYLQLGLYAQLAHQAQKRWPALGYYIIRDSRLLMLDNHFFPEASVIQPDSGESYLEFWQRVVATWKWRRQQIDRGLIEVPITDTEPDDNSTPEGRGLEMPDTFDRFDDYTVLTGWSEDA